jgi:hypothetical protein
MSGFPRDLAVLDPWDASLERSRARRARAGRRRARNNSNNGSSLSALLDARGNLTAPRDLAEEQPWELSLGRSRARRRAAELRFVPAGSRAKRISLGALAALTVGPTASLATDRQSAANPAAPTPNRRRRPNTRSRSARAAKAGRWSCSSRPSAGSKWTASSARNRSGRARLPGQQGPDRRRRRRPAHERRAARPRAVPTRSHSCRARCTSPLTANSVLKPRRPSAGCRPVTA